jgi:antiviral helicase SLH1
MNDESRKSNVEPLMAMLHSTLSSSRPNDDISGDIAELVGFDDIELVMEILDNRASIVQEVGGTRSLSRFLRSANSQS